MRERQRLCYTAAAVLLLTTAAGHAQCVAVIRTITQPGAFPSFVAGPIASNASILGVAKTDTSSGTPAVYFATYDNNLNPLTADRQVVATTSNGAAALLWNGSEFAVFFQSTSFALQFQRVDMSGNLIGPLISIVNRPWSPNDEFDVAWSPARNAYAVARTVSQGNERGVYLTVVSATGIILSDTQVELAFFGQPRQPRVLTLPDGTIGVVWTLNGDILPRVTLWLVTPSGTVKSGTVSERNVNASTVATDGSTILVIFSTTTSTGGTELRQAQFDTNAIRTIADTSFLTGSGTDIVPLHLAWNPVLSEWALTYIDAPFGTASFALDMRIRRFAAGATASDTLLSPDPLHSRLTAPYPIVFVNGAYIASIQRVISRAEGSESYLVKFCPFFVTATADHPVWRPFLPVTFTANTSGGSPGYVFDWQFGDNDVARGAVVQHIYQNPGTYTVTLTGVDAAGAVAITKTTVQIVVGGRQRAVRH
jgi:hypothetical protein